MGHMKREEVVAMLEEEKKREEYLLEERLTLLERQIERLSQSLERTRFYDYVEHLDSPRDVYKRQERNWPSIKALPFLMSIGQTSFCLLYTSRCV